MQLPSRIYARLHDSHPKPIKAAKKNYEEDAHNSKREPTSKAVKLPALTLRYVRKPATSGRRPRAIRFLPAYILNVVVRICSDVISAWADINIKHNSCI